MISSVRRLINRIKLIITDYLSKKETTDSPRTPGHESGETSFREREEQYHNIINEGTFRKKQTPYLDKKEFRQAKMLEYRRKMKEEQEEVDISLMHLKSFTIR